MAAEIGHQLGERGVVVTVDQRPGGGQIGVQPFAPGSPALIGEGGELGIGAGIDPVAQRRAAGLRKGRELELAVLERDDAPAAGFEDVVEASEHAVRGGVVEALAVIVDDPPAVADVVLVALDQRFVDVAFVEFGIAHQRDHPARIGPRQRAVRDEIVLHQAGEQHHRHPQPHRTRGEVDRDAILGAAGIALRAAQPAETPKLVERLVAEHKVDRMEQRPGVRLHRDLVVRPERVEIQRRHDRRHRRARRLMPADLQPITALPQMVGVVDGPCRQPAQSRVEPGYAIGIGRRRSHRAP